MPLLSDLMNPSYLLLLGVFVLSIALMYLYFENKMREQNHKISSMLSLVSSLAEEMNALRFSATTRVGVGVGGVGVGGTGGGTGGGVAVTSYPQRLTVSDDEEEEEEEDDEDEDEEEDSDIESLNDDDVVEEDDDDDDDEDDDDEGDDDEDDDNINSGLYTDNTVHMIEIGDSLNVKILKLNNQQQQQEQEFDLDNLEEIEDDDDDDEDDDIDVDELSVESSSDDDKENTNQTPLINLDDLKSINISNLDINNNNNNDESPMIEYKKLSVTKLRSIAQEKGLIEDASKLKKQELIDLLHQPLGKVEPNL
jgi:hypothetical protein